MKATIKLYDTGKLKSTERTNIMTTAAYTDEELRVIALPHAIRLVDQEVFRLLGKCNTASIAEIVNDLVTIVKTGKVSEQAKEPVVTKKTAKKA